MHFTVWHHSGSDAAAMSTELKVWHHSESYALGMLVEQMVWHHSASESVVGSLLVSPQVLVLPGVDHHRGVRRRGAADGPGQGPAVRPQASAIDKTTAVSQRKAVVL